ncbi:DoxX family membrane protein, partial [Streptomyces sp. GC420]|uniref:DoxX family membrane protein n=1 Tax=Streptomyces sp. GC420 TaxID=2697568 RepID=UPI001414F9AA
MSVDTRTPGFDDAPAPLSMVKVPSDPAQVIVNHASFRVQFAERPRASRKFGHDGPYGGSYGGSFENTARVPAAGIPGARRRAVVWSGRSDDTGPMRVLQAAARNATATPDNGTLDAAGATRVLPRVDVDSTVPNRIIGHPRSPHHDTPLLDGMRPAEGAYDEPGAYGGGRHAGHSGPGGHPADEPVVSYDAERGRRAGEGVRHAYYPGRRMNLGVVLLPLRIFLGFISVYAGMGKLCDPVYFDGGERGSMVKWLGSLHPWALAEPLRDFALTHPVGAGLSIAFLQVVVGVLTVLGLWQRLAASVGALLSAALIVTVSWKSVPAYASADIIYLAAWSPLIIAGAPVYSADARLAGEAWRTLGPRSALRDLRRRVLRRGALLASFVVGSTLLVGALLGGAVRSAEVVTVPGPGEAPSNH